MKIYNYIMLQLITIIIYNHNHNLYYDNMS